jgi:hypothetical protein
MKLADRYARSREILRGSRGILRDAAGNCSRTPWIFAPRRRARVMLHQSATMPSKRFLSIRAVAAAALLLIGTAAAGVPQGGAPAEALRAFESGLAHYTTLRARFEERLPSFDDSRRDGWARLLMRRYLASAIRAARREAQPGCIFGPVALLVRQTIAEAVYEVDIEGLVDGAGDEDEFALDLVLNEPVPSWAMASVPAALLERLPPLPAAVEYRLAGGALILWDTDAEIIVDALPDAFVAP